MKVYGQGILTASQIYFLNSHKQEQKIFFYPLCVGHYYCDNTYIVKRNSYYSYLVLYVTKGSAYYLDAHGNEKILHAGETVLLDCYKPHCYGSHEGCEIYWVHFDGEQGRDYYNYICSHQNEQLVIKSESIPHYLLRLYATIEQRQSTNDAFLSKYLVAILTEFMHDPNQDMQSGLAKLESARTYIDENLDQPIALEDLAELSGLSVFYFSRQFRKQFGCSPHAYVVQSRMNLAKFYLKATSLTISDIAYNCGFQNEGNFCTSFKKNTGSTPSEFRDLQNQH